MLLLEEVLVRPADLKFEIFRWPLTIMASSSSPYTDWLHHSFPSPSISWCVVGVLDIGGG